VSVCSLLSHWWGGEKNRKKKTKPVGWYKDSLIEQQRKRKTTVVLIKRIYKARGTQCSFVTTHAQPAPEQIPLSQPYTEPDIIWY